MIKIEREQKVADVLEKYPRTAAVFSKYGFGALMNPVLRATFGRVTTIERGCRFHGVDLEPFLAALNKAASAPESPEVSVTDPIPAQGAAAETPELQTLLNMNVADIVAENPRVREVFKEFFGAGCFDCPAFGSETVRFSSLMHGVDPLVFGGECLRLMGGTPGESPSGEVSK